MSMHTSPQFLQKVSSLVEERTGIAVHAQLRETLDEILHARGIESIDGYLSELRRSKETEDIWQELIHALTIGETYFLRDRSHFHMLRTQILPELIRKRRTLPKPHLNIWSVGCATGEEPYSLAITLHELLPDLDKWEINLFGTDLNAKALKTARRGVYRKWAFRHTDLDFQGKYFDPTPEGLQIKPHIQNMVTFRHANLLSNPPMSQFDLILCRNVLLYFSSPYSKKAEDMIFNTLTVGGWLLLGQSEVVRHERERWISHAQPNAPIYQKPSHPVHLSTEEFARITYQAKAFDERLSTAYDDAVFAIQNEQHEQAEKYLNALLGSNPDHASAHVLLAYILANRNQIAEAKQRIDMALSLDPLLADGYYLRAILYSGENELSKAVEALKSALYCQRNHPLACFMLGNLHAKTGEFMKAYRYWENVRSAIKNLTPDSPVSDISNITAGQLNALVNEHLEGWDN